MSKSLPNLRRLEKDLSEKLGGSFEVGSIIVSSRARFLASVEAVAIVGFTAFGIYRLLTVLAEPERFFWGAALAVGTILWFASLFMRLRSSSAFLRAGETSLTVGARGQLHRVIPYIEIDSLRFNSESEADWLRIVLRDGEELCLPFYQFTSTRNGAEFTLIRIIGPRLSSDTALERGPRPEGVMAAKAYDAFYQIPRVDLQSNVVYRYANTDELRKEVGGTMWTFFEHMLGGATLPLIFSGGLHWFVLIFLLLNSVNFWDWTPHFLLRKSLDDRFELIEDGLRVTRGNRSWIVPMEPTKGFLPSKIHYVHGFGQRLGRGRKIYYFDARFVEPDV